MKSNKVVTGLEGARRAGGDHVRKRRVRARCRRYTIAMALDRSSCYRALTARDPRFDGVFFVGVTSTRIYCRPVCRARTPRAANCRFYANAAAAERAGFRPCLRCRPELAPGNAPVDATAVLAERAARAIAAGALNVGSLDDLASSLGVTGRHLRRAVSDELGVSPIALATTHRLLLAKRLLHETTLPVAQVAYAAGFDSVRRFNAAFKARYRLAPAALRREAEGDASAPPPLVRRARTPAGPVEGGAGAGDHPTTDAVELMLEYRPPLHASSLLQWLAARAAIGAEVVDGRSYAATVRVPGRPPAAGTPAPHSSGRGRTPPSDPADVVGHVELVLPTDAEGAARDRVREGGGGAGGRHAVTVRLSPSLVPVLMPLLQRVRDLLDLDANPDVIARHLVRAGAVPSAEALAGVRIPGTLDGFALAVRAILGQQVSVRGATTVMGRLVERFGDPYEGAHPRLTRLMPAAGRLATLRTGDLATLGMPGARADAVIALARAVDAGEVVLDPGADASRTIRALTALPGIGDWTAHYIAMRALRWPDAFPANDLVLRRAAGNVTAAQLIRLAEPWRPWRAYAAMHLWRTASPAPANRS